MKEEEEIPIELEGIEEPHYEVEKILRWRKVKGTKRREYLILWTGYPLEEATWEPEENFDDRDQLRRYMAAGNIPEEI